MKKYDKMIKHEAHFGSVLQGFSEAFVTGKFCDVKVVCKDTNLWAHRLVLGSVSPFLRALLADFERRGEDVITIFLPLIQGYHMKLVLDYIYSGAMYLCGAHMQYVMQVMEVLQLKCGVSVNKWGGGGGGVGRGLEEQWVEVEHSTMHIKEYDGDHDTHRGEDKMELKVNGVQDSFKTTENDIKDKQEAKKDNITDRGEKLDKREAKLKPETDEDSEDDNDVVMVELDEDFVVERVEQGEQGGSQGSSVEEVGEQEQAAPRHRCALCGRTFAHYDNLQVHLTGHLGVKVNLNRCSACQRNFKNRNELELHERSHRFAKMLGKYKVNKSRLVNAALKKKIISTVGSKDKKIVRKYVTKRAPAVLTRAVERVARAPLRQGALTCALCDKSFGVRSIYVRHVKKVHAELASTLLQSLPSVKVRKCPPHPVTLPHHHTQPSTIPHNRTSPPSLPHHHTDPAALPSTPLLNGSTKPKRTPVSPKKFKDSFEKYENPTVATPNRFPPSYERSVSSPATTSLARAKAKAAPKTPRTPKTPKVPKSSDYYSTLECPDCSKVFVAKSIFERHLQSAKHGHFGGLASPASEGYPQWPSAPLTPQPSPVLSPGAPSGGGSPRIECHLCGQSFVRVKDLAKHREKVCSAYHHSKPTTQ